MKVKMMKAPTRTNAKGQWQNETQAASVYIANGLVSA